MEIELRNIYKKFKDGNRELSVLNDVNLTIKPGLTMLFGPSGCGKTTLLHIIGGLLKPDSGSVLFDGVDYYTLTAKDQTIYRGTHLGYIFQLFYLVSDFTVLDNVKISMHYSNMNHKERDRHAMELLHMVGLSDRAKSYPIDLSGGEQQRVAIARALANNSDVLLADEPTGNLDRNTAMTIMDTFHQLKESGKTILMVTHNEEYIQYADSYFDLWRG